MSNRVHLLWGNEPGIMCNSRKAGLFYTLQIGKFSLFYYHYCHALSNHLIIRKISVATSGFLLPHYCHKHHIIATFIAFLLPQTPQLLPHFPNKQQKTACFQPFLDRFMILLTSCNWRSDDSFKTSGKVISTIEQSHPRLCPTLPKALGSCARNYRLIVLMFSVIRAHVRGHKSSCTWAQAQYVTCYPLLYMLTPS